ncbi:HAD family hydrolase [Nonomuraea ferruginea]
MTRAVLFDLDGTLVDSRPAILDCYRAALEPIPPRAGSPCWSSASAG